jgi:transcription initiation factor TFIIF subunit alpha
MTVEDQKRMEEEVKASEAKVDGTVSDGTSDRADMSSVAPDGGGRRVHHPFQKKTRQVIAGNENSRRLRYEEHYPWVMEVCSCLTYV